MDEVLRFFVLRPPELKEPQKDAIALRPSAALAKEIEEALAQPDAVSAARSMALRHLAGSTLQGFRDLRFSPAIEALDQTIESAPEDTMSAAANAVKDAFGKTAAEITADPAFREESARLTDMLLCRKLAGRGGGDFRRLERAGKLLALVAAVAGEQLGASPRRFLARTLVIERAPLQIKQRPDLLPTGVPPPSAGARGEIGARVSALLAVRRAGRQALEELVSAPPEPDPGPMEPPARPGTKGSPKSNSTSSSKRSQKLAQTPMATRDAATAPLRLSAEGLAALSPGTASLLKGLKVDPAADALPRMASRITRHLRAVAEELGDLETADAGDLRVVRIGSSFYELGPIGAPGARPPKVLSLPVSHGTLRSVGVADLVVVRQALKRHERREISHVENVLPGEHKSREHERSRSTEETTTTERETTKEEERDLETAERFEIQRETQSLLHEELSLQVGASMSGSYGPSIEFTTSADFGMVQVKEEATRQASAYAKETIQRAATKITERVRQETTLRMTETFREANVHEVDNRGSAEGVTGVYQWIDKVYEAQVFNYGQRMMFDFVVPEPASLLLRALASARPLGVAFSKPIPFVKTAAEIDEDNYFVEAQRYDAQGVEPPPALFLDVVKTFDGADDRPDSGSVTKVIELPLPDGYEARKVAVVVSYNRWTEDASLDVLLAGRSHRFEKGTESWWTKSLDSPTGAIAIGLKTFRISVFAATFEFSCQRTARAMDAWRLKTHGLIKQAYLKQLQDHEEKVAAARQEVANEQRGQNPADNRLIERTELRRLAISTLTAQHFDAFGAIETGAFDLPQIDFAAAEEQGSYIRFFEQAFEWEQMMYVFYPYYWASKERWRASVLHRDDDPMFGEFLRAGAARVVLPVRPGFELALTHFLETGQIWEGGDPPEITSPMYLSIVDEIKERTGAPGLEVPQGDPWEIRVPTTLVALRGEPGLPSWSRSADGTWGEDP